MLFNTVPCPGCGIPVVIVTRQLNPAKGKYRSGRGGRSRRAPSERAFVPRPGGHWKLAADGVPYRAKAGSGDYAEHRDCRARPQAPGLRPTAGFRLD